MTVSVHYTADDMDEPRTYDTVTLKESGVLICLWEDPDGNARKVRLAPHAWERTTEVLDE